MRHELKTWPGPFQAVLDGQKHHEIRKADRPFAVGDVLVLREWERQRWESPGPLKGVPAHYTGRELQVTVTYLSEGGTWGLPPDLCVMSIAPLPDSEGGK